jgi:hypothetical protein
MIRTRDAFPARHTFGRAWAETEIDDDGELVLDGQPVHCPSCHHPLDLGGLDDIAVHRCEFCRKRTRFLWSDRRSVAVPEVRGPNADWGEVDWEELWRGYDFDIDHEPEGDGDGCANGCIDPIFDAPAEPYFDGRQWVCPCCGSTGEAD